jgi:hypothetical protein
MTLTEFIENLFDWIKFNVHTVTSSS